MVTDSSTPLQHKVTVVVPCFNEESSLPILYERLKKLMDDNAEYQWEVIMINDGSYDNTLEVLRQLHQQDKRICYISLSRNFGKENAMLAGIDYATGDCMVIIDADLQDPPEMIIDMLGYWKRGMRTCMPGVPLAARSRG